MPVLNTGVCRTAEATGADQLHVSVPGNQEFRLGSGGIVTGLETMMARLAA